MNNEKIYVVVGRCGRGSLKIIWMVMAYTDQAQADTHAANANASAERFYEMNAGESAYLPEFVNVQYDPQMHVDLITHTRYFVEVVPLGELISPEPITQEILEKFGFERIHMNAKWNGGWMRWVKDLSHAGETSIVVTFGDHYCLEDCVDFIVWIVIGDFVRTEMKLPHIKTVDQLRALWLAVCGEKLVLSLD